MLPRHTTCMTCEEFRSRCIQLASYLFVAVHALFIHEHCSLHSRFFVYRLHPSPHTLHGRRNQLNFVNLEQYTLMNFSDWLVRSTFAEVTVITTSIENVASLRCWDKHGGTASLPHKSSPRVVMHHVLRTGTGTSTYVSLRAS